MSCKKEEDIKTTSVESTGIMLPFRKEIVVTDSSGRNSAYYAIYSQDSNAVISYLKNSVLSLHLNKKIPNRESRNEDSVYSRSIDDNFEDSPELTVELLRYNLEPQVSSFSLSVKSSGLKTDFRYPTSYVTSNDYLGIRLPARYYRTNGDRVVIWVEKYYQWNPGPFFVQEYSDFQIWQGYPNSAYFNDYEYIEKHASARVKLRVRVQYKHEHSLYDIYYSKEEAYSNNCSLGVRDWYVADECYVGTAPSGTRAFVYDRNFYYTPRLSGEKCPKAGSWYDGAHCFVMDVPDGLEPYTWERNWYVKTDKRY